jgi:hypothetical protein
VGWPRSLSINAWTGAALAPSPLGANAARWAFAGAAAVAPSPVLPAEVVDPRNWRHPDVGWGLVLADNDALSEPDRARGADAPASIRKLLAARDNPPVLRYRPELGVRFLRRYYTNAGAQDIALAAAPRGTREGCLPRYLLIYGSPAAVPWEVQFYLNVPGHVGRLDLAEDEGLGRYVDALIGDWAGAGCQAHSPLLWSVDHGPGDITATMRELIGRPLMRKWREDEAIGERARFLDGRNATGAALAAALAEARPALVVTTSHGMTGPLGDASLMRAQLGMLVDDEHAVVRPELLLQQWAPDGAIWYAHACCSAGGDRKTRFAGLVEEGGSVDRVLKAVAALGEQVAQLPRKLLGAEKPLRAFVGHVEPTFDWTISQPETGQPLTASIERALYVGMYQRDPETVAMAFADSLRHAGELFTQWNASVRAYATAGDPAVREREKTAALRTQLAGLDRQSMVILGDPTVRIPPLSVQA